MDLDVACVVTEIPVHRTWKKFIYHHRSLWINEWRLTNENLGDLALTSSISNENGSHGFGHTEGVKVRTIKLLHHQVHNGRFFKEYSGNRSIWDVLQQKHMMVSISHTQSCFMQNVIRMSFQWNSIALTRRKIVHRTYMSTVLCPLL